MCFEILNAAETSLPPPADMCENAFSWYFKKTSNTWWRYWVTLLSHWGVLCIAVFSQQQYNVSSPKLSTLKHLSEIQAPHWICVTGDTHPTPKCPDLFAVTNVIYFYSSQTQDTLQLEGLSTRAFYGESGLAWQKIEWLTFQSQGRLFSLLSNKDDIFSYESEGAVNFPKKREVREVCDAQFNTQV